MILRKNMSIILKNKCLNILIHGSLNFIHKNVVRVVYTRMYLFTHFTLNYNDINVYLYIKYKMQNNIIIYLFTSLKSKLNKGSIYLFTSCNPNCNEEMLMNYGRNLWLWIGQHLHSIGWDLCWTPKMKFVVIEYIENEQWG